MSLHAETNWLSIWSALYICPQFIAILAANFTVKIALIGNGGEQGREFRVFLDSAQEFMCDGASRVLPSIRPSATDEFIAAG